MCASCYETKSNFGKTRVDVTWALPRLGTGTPGNGASQMPAFVSGPKAWSTGPADHGNATAPVAGWAGGPPKGKPLGGGRPARQVQRHVYRMQAVTALNGRRVRGSRHGPLGGGGL
ncbi:hypothetical protein AcdelDRAFT_4864, partial [Acidovorax delafieldii 2AN]